MSVLSRLLSQNRFHLAFAALLVTQLGTACGGKAEGDLAQSQGDGTGGCAAGDASCVSTPECLWGVPDALGNGCWIVEGCGSPSGMCVSTCPGYDPCQCGDPACAVSLGTGGSGATLSLEEKLASCAAAPDPAGLGGMGGSGEMGLACGEECGFCASVADCCSLGTTTYCLDNRCIGK